MIHALNPALIHAPPCIHPMIHVANPALIHALPCIRPYDSLGRSKSKQDLRSRKTLTLRSGSPLEPVCAKEELTNSWKMEDELMDEPMDSGDGLSSVR